MVVEESAKEQPSNNSERDQIQRGGNPLIPGGAASAANPGVHITIRRVLAAALSHLIPEVAGSIISSKSGYAGVAAEGQVGLDIVILARACLSLF